MHNILKTIPGAPDSYYCISKLLASLAKYRKLTNPVEFIRFQEECNDNFLTFCGTPKLNSCVVTSPSTPYATHTSPSRQRAYTQSNTMLVVPTPSTIRSSTPSDESPLLVVPPPLPLINELQPTNTSSSSPVKTRITCRNCKILRKSLAKCIAEKLAFRSKRHKKCKLVVRRIEQAPTTDKEKKRKRIGYHELPPKRLREYLNRRDETIEKLKKKRNTERDVSSPAENKVQILQDNIRRTERAERIYKKKIVSWRQI